jgi:hypothetical protein
LKVEIPADIDREGFVGLAFKFPDGTIDPFWSSNQWESGERAKIVVVRN